MHKSLELFRFSKAPKSIGFTAFASSHESSETLCIISVQRTKEKALMMRQKEELFFKNTA